MKDDPRSRVFCCGDCVLDLDRGVLERSGSLVPVRAKVFALLRHLAGNAGRVVGKGELLDAVWPDVTVTEDSLTQAIHDLRRALGDEGGVLVRTIPRRGYLFAIPTDTPAAVPPGGTMPRVAVLPFRNLTGDSDDGILIDGLVEEITNGLARFRTVTVVARHSAFAFRPEDGPNRDDIAARLGADYLVEGSVRRAGDRLAVAAGLAEARGGRRVWGDVFHCDRDDLLSLQQVIPRRIIPRLVANIEESVLARALAAPTASLTAFDHFTRAVALLRGFGEGVNERSRDHLLRAIEIDPNFGLAHAYLALADVVIANYGMAPREVLEAAKVRASMAVELAPGEARCHRILGYVRSMLSEHAGAEEALRRAYELNPFDADTLSMMSIVLDVRGRSAEALEWIDRAIALNPLHPVYYRTIRSFPLYFLGRYEESAAELALLPSRGARMEVRLAATLAMMGRMEEAAAHLDRAEALEPGRQHLEVTRDSYRCERAADLEHLLDGVRAALDGRARLRGEAAPGR